MELQLDYNEKRVIDLLRNRGPQSRSHLVHSARLTAPTLTRVVQNLLDCGLLKESHKLHDGQRGKPAQLLELEPDGAYSAGIAVQSEYVSVCLIDLVGRLRGEATKHLDSPEPQAVARLSRQMLAKLIADARVPRKRVVGAGICMPGTTIVETERTRRSGVPSHLPDEFAAWRGIGLETLFTDAIGMPVWLENSSKASALAETYFGAGQTLSHFAAIHIAYGIGGGLVLHRQLYRGELGRAAEFGGVFPYDDVRPSGRDFLLYLATHMKHPPRHLRDLEATPLPPDLIADWVERVLPGLATLCQHLAVALDLPAIVLNGLLPVGVLHTLAAGLRERLPSMIAKGLIVPQIHVSPLTQAGLGIGAASLPLHFVMAPEPR